MKYFDKHDIFIKGYGGLRDLKGSKHTPFSYLKDGEKLTSQQEKTSGKKV